MGRKTPYTEIGIRRIPCYRCGNSSTRQWQICSLNNEYKGLCRECDIKLNKIVLMFMKISPKEVHYLIEDYKEII